MKKFIKITTREGDAILRSWIDINEIIELRQNSITQQGNNEGTLIYFHYDMKIIRHIDIIAFDETIDSLNK
jgi:hypothetical protein